MDDKLHEECGVFGIYTDPKAGEEVAITAYLALYALQHRGQESAGISVYNGTQITTEKAVGLVSDVFDDVVLSGLIGHMALGHVRYSSENRNTNKNAQPMSGKFSLGEMAVAHNGKLINGDMLREMFVDMGYTFETSSGSEIIIKLIARSAKKGILPALDDMIQAIKGSYALVMMVAGKLIGVRDPNGIRPLCLGKIQSGYVLSSESCAFESIGAQFIRDVEPGETVIIDETGIQSVNLTERTHPRLCAFEYVYFARPDSTIDGISVHDSRTRAGERLFMQHPAEADVVIGVPDSGIDAALGYANASGIRYDIGLIKNKYVGRSFISPNQKARELAVQIKLNALTSAVKGKRVVMVDDSIVRGITCKKLISLLRRAGASEVHIRVASPLMAYPCYFGIDTPYRNELIGAIMNTKQLKEELGADSLGFLSLEGLQESINPYLTYCLGCLNGEYPMSVHPVEESEEQEPQKQRDIDQKEESIG